MSHRSLAAAWTAVAVVVLAPAFAAAQGTDAAEPPRTPWGAPDLQGVWDFRSITPMERPDDLAEQEFLTAEEAARLEQETVARNEELLNRPAVRTTATESVDTGENGAPGFYNNNVQIFQTPDTVALLNEMNHNVRVVPLDGRGTVDLPQWTGESRGHWEGDTLVVETTGFLRETSFASGRTDANLRLVERFTRVAPETLAYEATIDDPTVWTRPWTYQVPMRWNDQPLYEYACHEGNYGLYNILAGARAEEAAAGLEP